MSIVISGVPPQFCEVELEQRQQRQTNHYLETTNSLHRLYSNDWRVFFGELEELFSKGYSISNHTPRIQGQSYQILLTKPEKLLAKELEELKEKVRGDYIKELKEAHSFYESQLVAQMLQADQAKAEAAEEKKKQKRLEELKKIAANTYTPLEIPE